MGSEAPSTRSSDTPGDAINSVLSLPDRSRGPGGGSGEYPRESKSSWYANLMCSIVSALTSDQVHEDTGKADASADESADFSVPSAAASSASPTAAVSASTELGRRSSFESAFRCCWYLPTWFHHQSVL